MLGILLKKANEKFHENLLKNDRVFCSQTGIVNKIPLLRGKISYLIVK